MGEQEKQFTSSNNRRSNQPRAQPESLCNCPQKCGARVDGEVKEGLFKEFQALGDHHRQNLFLQSYIEMRSVYKRLWSQEERVGGRLQRRVSCKYKVPVRVPSPILSSTHPPRVYTNTTNGKEKSVVSGSEVETVEVCQKAFMNMYGVTEKRIRLQREKLIARLRGDSHLEAPRRRRSPIQTQLQYDISIVDSFFTNQLWKPEYIGVGTTSSTEHISA